LEDTGLKGKEGNFGRLKKREKKIEVPAGNDGSFLIGESD